MAGSGHGMLVFKKMPRAAGWIAVERFQNGELIASIRRDKAGDARRVVRCVRLKLAGAQSGFKRLACAEKIADGVGLVAVRDDGAAAPRAHGVIDDETGVGELRGVERLGADAVVRREEDAVAAVDAAAHDEIGHDGLASVGAAAEEDAAAGIAVFPQQRFDVIRFGHVLAPLQGLPRQAPRLSGG